MNVAAETYYHIYNQGNRRQQLFFKEEHYFRFVEMLKKYVVPNATMMAYCLMPNHFHCLVLATEKSAAERKQGNIVTTELSNGFRMLQSSFAQSINAEQNEFGSLFKQKAQAKEIKPGISELLNVFCYIHQNPKRAGLVSSLPEWKHSSFGLFAGVEKESIIDTAYVLQLLDLQQVELMRLLDVEVDGKTIRTFV